MDFKEMKEQVIAIFKNAINEFEKVNENQNEIYFEENDSTIIANGQIKLYEIICNHADAAIASLGLEEDDCCEDDCCCGHHHDDEEGCCCGHHHDEEDCCCGHHHEDGHCCHHDDCDCDKH